MFYSQCNYCNQRWELGTASTCTCVKNEPVAWGVSEGNLHDMFFTQSEAQEMAKLKGTHVEVRPLYATPQRTWVGLTEDEIDALHMEVKVRLMGTFNTKDIYRAVEAKLRSKNI